MNFGTLLKNADGYALAFKAKDITSAEMRLAIPSWFDLYFHNKPSEDEDPCQQIPYTIVQKLTKTVFSEYEATSEDEYASRVLSELERVSAEAMQMALVGGECRLKPIIARDGFRFNVIPRYNILVFARDSGGNMTDIGTVERSTSGNSFYTLLERRTVDENGYLTIRNRLFRSYNEHNLGQEVPLSELPQYEQLVPEFTFSTPVGSIGLVGLKTPMVNCVDGTQDPVSVYASAVGLIHNINRNEAQINGEFERGESRVIVSADMLQKDTHGKKQFSDHLFVGLDEDQETVGVNIFSPQLREASFLARKQEYLRNVENVIGLKRGLLSEVEAAERTATEITSSAGEYNLTIIDFQRIWEDTVREAMRLCSVLGQIYKVQGAHAVAEDAVAINWGNGILYDEEKTWEDYKAMVAAGLLKPEIALGWRFGMPTETPEDLKKIREKYMPDALDEGAE
jgi:A118 family predicted phage portal protein